MLVIRRRAGEAVLVGSEIEIQIIEVSPSRVKLGITAPQHVSVMRKETQLTRDQNVAAARGVPVRSRHTRRRIARHLTAVVSQFARADRGMCRAAERGLLRAAVARDARAA